MFNNPISPTHFSSFKGTFSTIDLTITSPELQTIFNWNVHSDLCGSDHFPIVLNPVQKRAYSRRPKWKLEKADWLSFQNNLVLDEIQNMANINQKNSYITKAIIDAAHVPIPKSSSNPKRPPVPWWSDDIAKAIKERKRALRVFKSRPTTENLELFRLMRARSRRLIVSAKKESFKTFVQSIDLNTSTTSVWKKIRSLKGIEKKV